MEIKDDNDDDDPWVYYELVGICIASLSWLKNDVIASQFWSSFAPFSTALDSPQHRSFSVTSTSSTWAIAQSSQTALSSFCTWRKHINNSGCWGNISALAARSVTFYTQTWFICLVVGVSGQQPTGRPFHFRSLRLSSICIFSYFTKQCAQRQPTDHSLIVRSHDKYSNGVAGI